MKNVVFWDVAPCGSCKDRRFGGRYRLHLQGGKNQLNANVVPSSLTFPTLKMEVTRSSKSSFLTGLTWCHIPQEGILYFQLNNILSIFSSSLKRNLLCCTHHCQHRIISRIMTVLRLIRVVFHAVFAFSVFASLKEIWNNKRNTIDSVYDLVIVSQFA
jgi:hypothetical protein